MNGLGAEEVKENDEKETKVSEQLHNKLYIEENLSSKHRQGHGGTVLLICQEHYAAQAFITITNNCNNACTCTP